MSNQSGSRTNPARFLTDLVLDARDVVLGAAFLGVMRAMWRYQRTQYEAAQPVRPVRPSRARDSFIAVARDLN